ncbi:MAG TPA: YqgE/AlgH family protein [Mucilaginibacter sp.]|nr:YqgE/AlgH family protein [Mucilaginibacter sp.]
MLSLIAPDSGRLLVSEPFMLDPNFKRSVILLAEYGDEGAVGFVLNHESEYQLGDLVPDIAYSEMPVYIGGPVGAETLHFIHRVPEKIEGGLELAEGVYWGGDFDTVKELLTSYQLSKDDIRFFMGYSGWTSGQLDAEIGDDAWIVTDKYDPAMLFSHDEQNLWKDVVKGLGQRYAHIANFPENPMMN